MTRFIMLHGGFSSGWAWHLVDERLRAAGHPTETPTLPGHSGHPVEPAAVTFDLAVGEVGQLILASREPVVLAAHSMACLVITRVAELYHARIKALMFVCGALQPSGHSLASFEDATESVAVANVRPHTRLSVDKTVLEFDREAALDLFYNTTSPDLAQASIRRFCRLPLAYVTTPVFHTEERFGRLPKTYVLCAQDRALPPARQRHMIQLMRPDRVVELDCDHSPALCRPDALAGALLAMA